MRPSLLVSSSFAACSPRARARTERLAQSRPRSSSSSAPRMRVEAKRSNAMPRSGSKLRAACARPSMPADTRSLRLTWFGTRCATSETTYWTSGEVLPHQLVLVRRPLDIDLGVQDAPRHPKRLLPEALQRFRPQQASALIIPGWNCLAAKGEPAGRGSEYAGIGPIPGPIRRAAGRGPQPRGRHRGRRRRDSRWRAPGSWPHCVLAAST